MDDRDVVRALGALEGSIKGLSTQQELTRVSVEAQGQRIASLPCNHHGKKISDLFKRVGVEEENTQRFKIERDVKTKVKKDGVALWKILVPAAVAAIGTIGGVVTAFI